MAGRGVAPAAVRGPGTEARSYSVLQQVARSDRWAEGSPVHIARQALQVGSNSKYIGPDGASPERVRNAQGWARLGHLYAGHPSKSTFHPAIAHAQA